MKIFSMIRMITTITKTMDTKKFTLRRNKPQSSRTLLLENTKHIKEILNYQSCDKNWQNNNRKKQTKL